MATEFRKASSRKAAPDKKMRLCDYIAQFLVKRGVADIFMLTGSGAMYINDAIKVSGIRYYATRNEATAPMMAEAYARVRQSLGAVCVTAGPGATNAVPGLAEAFVDSAPVLILSGQVTSKHTTHYANIPGLRTFGTAEIDIVPIVQHLTKFAAVVDDPRKIRYLLEKALCLATTGRPGPVWLDVPLDIQQAMVDPAVLKGYTPPAAAFLKTDLTSAVDKVLRLLRKAKRPLIVAGQGVRQGKAIGELKILLERFDLPAVFSRLGQDLLPHTHPNVFGKAGVKGSRFCKDLMGQADCVIALGSRLAPQFAGLNFEGFAPQAKIVMVDIDKAELNKPGVALSLKVHADVGDFLKAFIPKLKKAAIPHWGPWLKTCQALKAAHPMVLPEQKRNPIDLYYFMDRLGRLSDRRHILITDAGSNYYVGGQVFGFEKGQREITSGTNAAMGTTIPLAIGSCVAAPGSQVLAVTGDGSLELNIQELKTISHYKLNLKLFVINNGGYVSMHKWQDACFEGRRIDTEEATGTGTLNMRKVAAAFDLNYECIERYEEIDDKLREIMSDPSPLFVEVMTDHNQQIFQAL